MLSRKTQIKNVVFFNPNSMGGGLYGPCDAKLSEKCPCSHNCYTVLIKHTSLFVTALVMTNT